MEYGSRRPSGESRSRTVGSASGERESVMVSAIVSHLRPRVNRGPQRPPTLIGSGQNRHGVAREVMVSPSRGIGRRSFLTACGGAVLGLTWSVGRSGPARAQAASPDGPKKVTIVEFS